MVDGYAHRNSILKGPGSTGSGARPTNGGGTAGGKSTMTRNEFNKLDPMAQMKAMTVDKIQVVDSAA